jgi:hypothetical protein
LRKSRVEIGCPVYTRSENAIARLHGVYRARWLVAELSLTTQLASAKSG